MLSLTGAKKSSSLAVIKPKTSMIPAAKISNSKKIVGSKSNNLQLINVKVLEIESMITTKLIRETTKSKKDKKKAQKEDRNEQEKDLEKGKDPGNKKIKIPKVPKLGVFGWLKRFIGSIILAFFANKMLNHLPKLVGLVKGIQNVIEFVSDIGIKLVDGLATFVDWGYKAYDATQGFLKNFGVKQEQFDQFSGALSGLIDALIIGSVILAARGEDGFGPGGLDKARRPGGRKPGVTTGRGGQKPRFRNPFGRSPVTRGGKPGMPGAPVSQGRGGKGPRPRVPGTGPKVTGGTKGLGAIGKIKRFLGPIGGKLLGPVFFLLDFFGRISIIILAKYARIILPINLFNHPNTPSLGTFGIFIFFFPGSFPFSRSFSCSFLSSFCAFFLSLKLFVVSRINFVVIIDSISRTFTLID